MEERHSIDTRYECTLGKQLLLKAIAELNEPQTNEERLQQIDRLRNSFIENNKTLKLMRKDDKYILRFLRAKKFDHHQALNMMTNYHNQLQSWPEVSEKVQNPKFVKYIFDAGSFVPLRQKAYDGSTICIGRPGKARIQMLTDYYAVLIISINRLLDEEEVQINGITLIQDLKYTNYNVAKQFPKLARRVYALFENALPIRLKSVYLVHQPIFLEMVLIMMRPFMKAKFRQRLLVLGQKYAHLHKIIESSTLPSDYGGTNDDFDRRDVIWWKNVVYEEDDIST